MSDKSIYSNPYFYMFLMDDSNKYFITYRTFEDTRTFDDIASNRIYKFVKSIQEEREIRTRYEFEHIFGYYNVVGKNEMIKSLLSLHPGGVSRAFNLYEIDVIIDVSSAQEDDMFYPWTFSMRYGERIFKINVYIHVEINIKFRDYTHTITVNCSEMGMAARIVFNSFVQKMIQLNQSDEEETLMILNKFEKIFENHFVNFDEDDLRKLELISPLVLYNIVDSKGYGGCEFIRFCFLSPGNSLFGKKRGNFRLINNEMKMFKYSLFFERAFFIFENEYHGGKLYSPAEIVISDGSKVDLEVEHWFKDRMGTTFFAFNKANFESYDAIEKHIFKTMSLGSNKHPIPLSVRNEAFQKIMDFIRSLLV